MPNAANHKLSTSTWYKPIDSRDFDWIATIDDLYFGHGKTELEAIDDLMSSLRDDEDFEGKIETTCLLCRGDLEVEVTHHLYGSPYCPEPTEDIECPMCRGTGELLLELDDFLAMKGKAIQMEALGF